MSIPVSKILSVSRGRGVMASADLKITNLVHLFIDSVQELPVRTGVPSLVGSGQWFEKRSANDVNGWGNSG